MATPYIGNTTTGQPPRPLRWLFITARRRLESGRGRMGVRELEGYKAPTALHGHPLAGNVGHQRRGAAAVEFAVVLPLLLLVLMGIWEVGRMEQVHQILETAAREGARQAAAGNRTVAEVRQVVLQYLVHSRVPTANAVVTVDNLSDPANTDLTRSTQMDQLRINVSVPVSDIRWIALARITSANTVLGSATWYSLKDKEFPRPADVPIE